MRLSRTVCARLAAAGAAVGVAWGVMGAGAVGCSSSSAGASSSDASEDLSVTPVEASDDGAATTDVDAGPPIVFPRVYIVNASPDAPPLRFCFGLRAGDAGSVVVGGGLPATPDTPWPGFPLAGVFPGYGGPLDGHGLDLAQLALEVFALDATSPIVAANTSATGADASTDGGADASLEAPCEALVGPDGLGLSSDAGGALQPGRDFWSLGTFAAGTFAHGTTWLAAVTGCLPGESSAAALCPAGYDPTVGDLGLVTWSLDTTFPPDAGALGAQLAQASSEWDNFARAAGGITSAGFLLPGDGGAGAGVGDASLEAGGDATSEGGAPVDAASPPSPWASFTQLPIATDAGFGALQPATLAAVPGLAFDGSVAFFAQVAGPVPIPSMPLGWPLPAVQAQSWPGVVPGAGVLRDGAGFVFVLLGNPAVTPTTVNPIDGGAAAADAGGVLNGHAPHVLAFPVANP